MGYGCCSIEIERNKNGYEVTVTDPKIVAANQARDGKGNSVGEWKSPEIEYQFQTKEQVLAFITSAFDDALPEEEYSSTFDKLAKEAAKS